jgi:hypothetical protein
LKEGNDVIRKLNMDQVNPKYVLRTYLAQVAIDMAKSGDFSEVHLLRYLFQNPYDEVGYINICSCYVFVFLFIFILIFILIFIFIFIFYHNCNSIIYSTQVLKAMLLHHMIGQNSCELAVLHKL